MTLLVHFYIAQILPEPEVVRLFVYHIKNLPWFPLSKALTFIPIGSLVAMIQLYRQFRVLWVYFRNRKYYRKNLKNHFYYSQIIHPVQISALQPLQRLLKVDVRRIRIIRIIRIITRTLVPRGNKQVSGCYNSIQISIIYLEANPLFIGTNWA